MGGGGEGGGWRKGLGVGGGGRVSICRSGLFNACKPLLLLLLLLLLLVILVVNQTNIGTLSKATLVKTSERRG